MPPRKKKAAVASTSKSKSIAQEILIVSDDESASQSSSVQILPPSVSPSTRLRSSAARQRALELVTVVDQSDPRSLLASQRERFTGKGTCRCGNDLIPPSSTSDNPSTIKLSTKTVARDFISLGVIKCSRCSQRTCRGCWERVKDGIKECCAPGRAIVLFEILSVLDRSYLAHETRWKKPVSTNAKGAAAKKQRVIKPIASGSGGGVGYGAGGVDMGVGYPGGQHTSTEYMEMIEELEEEMHHDLQNDEDEEQIDHYNAGIEEQLVGLEHLYETALAREKAAGLAVTNAQSDEKVKANRFDEEIVAALGVIAELLPHPESDSAQIFDYMPDPSFTSLLLLSTFPELITDLLRNDSVTECSRRSTVYFALVQVLNGLSDSHATLGVLFEKRRDKAWSEGLNAFMRSRGDIVWETTLGNSAPLTTKKATGKRARAEEIEPGKVVTFVAPLSTHLSRLVIQANAFVNVAKNGYLGEEDSETVGLCGDLQTCGERCERARKMWVEQRERDGIDDDVVMVLPVPTPAKSTSKAKGKGKAVAIREPVYSRDQYDSACRALSYAQVVLSNAANKFPSHLFSKEIESTANARRPAFVHLAKELAVLSTNLPAGIWLRVDEARIDCLKCLIAGPEDTPYAGGLFEFDIYIPLQYPNTPPLVKIRTTGGGRVRFNPNLYADGKTCLSLIGTWPGRPDEMWQNGKSTLLQVLISIQSMILGTSLPYFNEPGYGAPKICPQSKNYNLNVSLATVRWASLPWLAATSKTSIWSDVIVSHFTLLESRITATLRDWTAKDSRLKAWTTDHDRLAGGANISSASDAHAQAMLVYAAMVETAGSTGKGKGKAPPPPVAPPIVTRDLIKEYNEAMGQMKGWKSGKWLKQLIE